MIHYKGVKQAVRKKLFETACSLSSEMFSVKIKKTARSEKTVGNGHTRITEKIAANDRSDSSSTSRARVETCPRLLHLEENSAENSYRVYSGSPEKLRVFNNVIYFPQFHCLYDQDGHRIEPSCYSTKLKQLSQTPKKVEVGNVKECINDEVIYISDYAANMHYGHFLIEAIAPLWYTLQKSNIPILTNTIPRPFKKTFIDEFFNTYCLEAKREVWSFNKPVLLRSAIVPFPSFTFCYEAYTAHCLVPERVAALVVDKYKPKSTEQPLYFSRTQLRGGNRSIVGELELEQILQTKGFFIAYPEQLSLAEQICLINKHKAVVGCRGSALHGMLFDLSQENKMVCFSDIEKIDKAFLMVDAIKSVDSTYIGALSLSENKIQQQWSIDRSINVVVAIEALNDIGLL